MPEKRSSQAPVLIVYAVTMIICLAVFGSVAMILLEVFVNQPREARQAAAGAGNAAVVENSSEEQDFSKARETILFVGADGSNINGMALIRVLPDLLTVKVVPISPYTWSIAGGTEGTIASLFDAGGMSYLKTAVENAYGVSCDKYIKITNDGFRSLVDYLGGTSDYNFPQELYYRNDETGEITSFSQGAATRTLYGDDIRKIVTYPMYEKGNEAKVQVLGELAVSLINSACTYNSGAVVGNIQTIFNEIYNNSDSDLTSKGFADVREAYEHLISSNPSPATYRMPSGLWDARGYFMVGEDFRTEIREYFELG